MNEEYADVSKVILKKITKETAKKIIEENHYSHNLSSWINRFPLGIYMRTDADHKFFEGSGSNEELIGCIVYSHPVSAHAAKSINVKLKFEEVLELTRLWIADGYGKNLESYVIAQSFRWLKEHKPEVKALISFADPSYGHAGVIYQATNWLYQGCGELTVAQYDVRLKPQGKWIHNKSMSNTYGVSALTPERLYKKLGHKFWRRPATRKHRYIYFLCGKAERRWLIKTLSHPIRPYPKENENKQYIEEIDMVNGELRITRNDSMVCLAT